MATECELGENGRKKQRETVFLKHDILLCALLIESCLGGVERKGGRVNSMAAMRAACCSNRHGEEAEKKGSGQ